MQPTVKDVMTTNVIWVRKDASVKEIAAALREHRLSAFPVLDGKAKVIGVVSESDMLTKEALIGEQDSLRGDITAILHHKDEKKAHGITAGDLMTGTPVTVAPEATVEHAARLMYKHRVKQLPVGDASGHLVGIVSWADVLAVFGRSDEEIRKEITDDVILYEFLDNRRALTVTVKDGVVTLQGAPETNTTGHAIVRRVRHVPGVVAVRDRLYYPPPDEPGDHFDVLANFPPD
jgi:CBS domain-containing protein